MPELKAFYGSLVACHAVEEGRLPDLPPAAARRPGWIGSIRTAAPHEAAS